MSIRAMFVGNSPARKVASAAAPKAANLAAVQREAQAVLMAMLGEEAQALEPTALVGKPGSELRDSPEA